MFLLFIIRKRNNEDVKLLTMKHHKEKEEAKKNLTLKREKRKENVTRKLLEQVKTHTKITICL